MKEAMKWIFDSYFSKDHKPMKTKDIFALEKKIKKLLEDDGWNFHAGGFSYGIAPSCAIKNKKRIVILIR